MAEPAMVGVSAAHRHVLQTLSRVAPTDAEVLITGPTGVGKELYARFTHQHSRRRAGAFVSVNCGNLPGDIMDNELFGHARGAYTGAQTDGIGLAEATDGGTLFFDEIDALPLPCQAKLLRFIQNKEYRRLGETRIRRVDVRIIGASNADLPELMKTRQFREDLFFRVRVIPVEVKALAERRDDIPVLLVHFVRQYSERYGVAEVQFTTGALRSIESYAWPGNVRELENCVRYLTCLQLGRPVSEADLPLMGGAAVAEEQLLEASFQEAKRALIQGFERRYLENALRASGGNIARAARASGKARRAFFELLRKYHIDARSF